MMMPFDAFIGVEGFEGFDHPVEQFARAGLDSRTIADGGGVTSLAAGGGLAA